MRLILLTGLATAVLFAQDAPEKTADSRLRSATETLHEMMNAPDKGIPQDLLNKAHCVVVIPNLLKGAFIVGGKYGKGYAVCRRGAGWSAPAAVQIEGGSFGFQIGGSSTDVIMLVMNQNGMNHLLTDKFVLGGEAAAAAGPLGRRTSAETDAQMRAEILTWSRSRGVFAGISLDGATLHADHGEDQRLYGGDVSNREILEGRVPSPPAARSFEAALRHFSNQAEAEARSDRNAPATPDADRDMARNPEPSAALSHPGGRMTLGQNEVRFATGKSDVPPGADAALNRVAKALKDHPDWRVRIEGYTDNVGSKAANQKLSLDRATAVMNWLADHGVDRSRMSAHGRGESHPIADNSTAEGRARNRRVEIVRVNIMTKTGE